MRALLDCEKGYRLWEETSPIVLCIIEERDSGKGVLSASWYNLIAGVQSSACQNDTDGSRTSLLWKQSEDGLYHLID